MHPIPEDEVVLSSLRNVDIPPCPSILLEVDRELKKASVDVRTVAQLISRDVALSGHVIQIANSPAFTSGKDIRSLDHALQLLGTQRIFNLVIVQLLKTAMSGADSLSMERFWESSAQVARLSAELARRLRCIGTDVAYTFGLFHDCGIPLLMKHHPDTKRVLAAANQAEDGNFTAIEDQHLGTNHAVVGYFLARRWRLPADICKAIQLHHDYSVLAPTYETELPVKQLIALNVLAEHIIRLHGHGDGEHEWAKAASPACAIFGLSLGAIDDLIEDMCEWLG